MKNMALTAHKWLCWAGGGAGVGVAQRGAEPRNSPAEEGACETGEEGQPHGAQGLVGDANRYPASNDKPPRG